MIARVSLIDERVVCCYSLVVDDMSWLNRCCEALEIVGADSWL